MSADKPQAKLIYQRVVEERDALLAENQRDKERITWLEGEEEGWRTGLLAQTKRLGECQAENQRLRDVLTEMRDALLRGSPGWLETPAGQKLAAAVRMEDVMKETP